MTMDASLWRNTFPSSHVAIRFPLELLQRIFLLLVDLNPREPSHPPSRPDWITITYVCRYWREAALSLCEHWTHITPNLSISWSQAMMERSAPLPVHIDKFIGTYTNGLEVLAASGLLSASRIRTLRLSGRLANVLKVLNCLCGPSPLESLTLCIFNAVEAIYLPETLCASHTPNLRRLTFETNRCVRMPPWLLAGITHFTTSVGDSMDELLCTLQAMPQLKELCINREFNYVDSEPVQRPPAHVALPLLSLLTILSDFPRLLVALSAHIVDASLTTLRRHLFWRETFLFQGLLDPDIFARVLDLVPRDSAPGADDGGLRAAHVTGGPELGSFEVWSRSTRTVCAARRSDALFRFRLEWQRSSLLLLYIRGLHEADGLPDEHCPFFHLAGLCAHLQTTRVEDLTVAPAPSEALTAVEEERVRPKEVAQWRALLAALPAVKILRLHGSSPAGTSVLRVLKESPGLLPHLRKVFVVQSTILCAGDVPGTDAGATVVITKNIGAELAEAVSVRSGLEVVLVGCEVDEEALEALRRRARVDFGNEWEYMQNYHPIRAAMHATPEATFRDSLMILHLCLTKSFCGRRKCSRMFVLQARSELTPKKM